MRNYSFIIILSLISLAGYSQGDGPHAYLLTPKGVTGASAKWLYLDQNILPVDILTPGANIKVNILATSFSHSFSIGGRYAKAFLLIRMGAASAIATSVPPAFPIPVGTVIKARGFTDGFAGFRVGLHGAPALSASSFKTEKMRFSLFADVRLWYSGNYDPDKLMNMGSNRQTFEFSFPMVIPLNKVRERATWLEVCPSIEFFTANKNPSRRNQAQQITQAPLVIVENHLTHYFTKKLWGIMSLRYRYGGQTFQDGVKDGNPQRILGSAFGAGYHLFPFLGIYADYGKAVIGFNGAKTDMIRFNMTFNHVSRKKK